MHSPFNDLCQRAILPWITRGGSDVCHAREANELLEVASDELRAIVGDDSRLGFQVLLLGSLQDHFDIGFSHRLTQIPMHPVGFVLKTKRWTYRAFRTRILCKPMSKRTTENGALDCVIASVRIVNFIVLLTSVNTRAILLYELAI